MSNKRSNQKVQLKNSGWQKESNQMKQRKSNGKRTGFIYYSGPREIFTMAKTCLSWLNGYRVSRQNSRHLNRLILINERNVIQNENRIRNYDLE